MSAAKSSVRSGSATVVALSCAAYALLGALSTIAGWAFNLPILADWDSDGIAQMPNNAIAVAATAAALICAVFGKRRTGTGLAALAAAITTATLFEYITGINLGIDTLVFHREWGQRGTLAPGRMGLPGAIAVTMLSVSTVLGVFGRARRLATTGGFVAVGIGLLSITGYLFQADPLYAIPRFTTIALQTSTMVFALGIALLASIPDAAPVRLLLGDSAAALVVRRALPSVVFVPMLLGWLRLVGQDAGLFDTEFGTALLVLTLTALLVALLWWAGVTITHHEAAVLDSRNRLATILGSITDAFLMCDAQWRLVFVNRETETLLGLPRHALIGKTLWDVLPEAGDPGSHEKLRKAMTERTSAEYEVFYPAWRKWFLSRAYPTDDGGVVIYARDVTERKQDEQAIRESQQKFSLLFDKTPFGAALARLPEGTLVDVNDAFARTFGYSREETIGKTSLELGINSDPETRKSIFQQLERSGSVRDLELHLRTRSGEERTFLNDITLVEVGGVQHLLSIVQDITERKAAEQAARRSAEALLAADRMKDEFLATLSHELRTPLTAIVGWSQLLMSGLPEQEQQTAFEAIRSSAKAQTQLIEDVLDVSRIITGKMRLQRHVAECAPIIEAAVATVQPAAEAKRIALHLTVDPDLPKMFVDPERIQQVVWNLLSNAIKFSPPETKVEIRTHFAEGACVLEVIDEGPGIAKDFLPHVFERFRQADSSTSRSHSGLGIGLALTKDLVELHGGSVDVESEPGRGARFTVRLPTLAPHPDQAAEPAVLMAAEGLSGVRVLYVDDREDARLLISTMLKRCGAEVVVAESTDEALLALVRTSPHVVITDLAMPGRDGYDLLSTIRGESRWDQVPVLALTAQARNNDETRASSAGFEAFLRKPIESQELAAAVMRALTERATAPR